MRAWYCFITSYRSFFASMALSTTEQLLNILQARPRTLRLLGWASEIMTVRTTIERMTGVILMCLLLREYAIRSTFLPVQSLYKLSKSPSPSPSPSLPSLTWRIG